MNILGENFSDEIIKQIFYRQKVYGSGYEDSLRSNEQILYLNSKTAWCKLISGVNIDNINNLNNPFIETLGLQNDELAKKFILFNGTFDSTDGEQKAGITPIDNPTGYNYAYGIGGNNFGIRPMMGIQQASIKHENNGSIRRAEVKIKAFNKNQFDIIDTLYLRQGFTVLLEWGHSIILDNNGNIDTNPVGVSLENEFFKDYSYSSFLKLIFNQRLATGGNYDSMLAKISNFSWSFLPDGSYDITVYLVSIGDVVESLKTNVLTDSPDININVGNNTSQSQQQIFEEDIPDNIIGAFAHSHNIGNFFQLGKTLMKKVSGNSKISSLSINPSDINEYSNLVRIVRADKNLIKFNLAYFDQDQDDFLAITYDNLGGGGWWNGNQDNIRYYIRLGTFLRFLQVYIIPTYYNKNNELEDAVFIDTSSNTNLMNVLPLQIAVDPRICFIQRTIPLQGDTYYYGLKTSKSPFINSEITTHINKKNIFYGNIMNIHIDVTYILGLIYGKKDDKGNLSLIDFLQTLMSGLNEGLGGVNNFDVTLDETNNVLRVLDKNPLNNLNEVSTYLNEKYPDEVKLWNNDKLINTSFNIDGILELYGYWPKFHSRALNSTNTGDSNFEENYLKRSVTLSGFIKEFSLTSQMSPAFSNMITVGATSQGSVVGENDTALSKMNKGLLDRFKVAITTDINPPNSPNSSDSLSTKTQEYNRMLSDYINNFLVKMSNGTDSAYREVNNTRVEFIEAFKSNFSSLTQKAIEIDKLTASINNTDPPEQYQGTGFLPFNLSLKMDGLSGIKIGQKFAMDTSYLPSNYPDVLNFIIKNISHEITNNKWETRIETYAVNKAINTSNIRSVANPGSDNSQSSSTGNVINRDNCDIKTIPPSRKVPSSAIATVLLSAGYSKAAAAGVLGNIENESNFDLNAYNTAEGGCGAYGLAQWRGDRQTDLYNYANSIGSTFNTFKSQVSFIVKEVSEIPGLREYKNIQDPEKAAFEFASKFERFEDAENPNNPQNIARKRSAKRFFASLVASSVSLASSTTLGR